MGCCCSEVRQYAKQLSNLIKAKGYMESVINNIKDTDDFVKKSGEKLKEAVILNTAEKAIGDELIVGYSEAVSQCSEAYDEVKKAIELVSGKLKILRYQDLIWHSSRHRH